MLSAGSLGPVTDGGSSIPEVQALLATLVASKPGGRFAETGTAFGKGARAIAEAMDEKASFVTVELDADRYEQAAAELAGTRAEVIHGHWHDVLPQRGPFDLLFADAGLRGTEGGLELSISLLAPGGVLVKDDMSPARPIDGDEIREGLLRDPRLIATEVLTTPSTAAIIAVRR